MNRYAQWLLRNRIAVIIVTLMITGILGYFGAGLKIVIDPATLAPQGHPYIDATKRVEKAFGSKYLMLIGITPKKGDIFQPEVLQRVQRLTQKLDATPGVVRSTLMSIGARQAKGIKGSSDGFEARSLLPANGAVTQDDITALKAALDANPVYRNTVVSADNRTAAILVELQERPDGFHKMVEPITQVVQGELSPDVDIALGGNPVYLDKTEVFAERINLLFPIAVLVIGLLHFEAFRSKQGMILPLVTALMAVVWGMGFMGMLGQPMDVFNSPTPILILAVAAGHAVQLLKRYYEEYDNLRREGRLSPVDANRQAVVQSLIGVGPVMMIAGGVAAVGFFSLLSFNIPTIRAFGIFTGLGILSAVVVEMTFIPAVRSLLKPPPYVDQTETTRERIWDRIPRWIGNQVVPASRRRWVMVGIVATIALCALGMNRIVVDNASKNFFAGSLDIQKDDEFLNQQLGGTNSLYIMVEGQDADSMKDPAVLQAIESTQRYAESLPFVGKTISIVDYVKRMNQAMHGDAPAAFSLPASRELISQYLFLYTVSGDPGDFDSYVDYAYKAAKITILLKTGSNAEIKVLVDKLKAHTDQQFGNKVRISFGGDVTQTIALTDTMVRGKLLNIAQIGLAVFVISALVFRSLLAGFIVLAPLALAVLGVFGLMGGVGIPLNIPNSLIAAMAVGIGADYAIYFLYRMREIVAQGVDADAAARKTLATAGKASLFVATAVAGGYGVLALSIGYNVHQWLALFIVVAMIVSLLASLTLVPSLVLYWKPRFIFQSVRAQSWWQVGAVFMFAFGLLMVVSRIAHAAPALNAAELMDKSAEAIRVNDSFANATFTLTNREGVARVRKTSGYTKLRSGTTDNMRLVRFLAPADIKGTATLLIENSKGDDSIWVYLPALSKVRRLSASNKRDAFVGTDFSYGDVIGHKTTDWVHKLVKEDSVDGAACYLVESTPANDTVRSNSGYSKRLSCIRKDNFVAARTEIWDLADQPLKRIRLSDIKPVGRDGHWQAMLSVAENLQTGHQTAIQLEAFKADQNVSEKLFTPQELDK